MRNVVLTGVMVIGLALPGFAADEAFVMKAAKGNIAEVELGKLAVDKGSSEEVKQFGRRLVDDHGKANEELKTLANSKHMTVPAEMDPKDKALRDRLSRLSGAAFDRAYMKAMVTDHVKDISEFRMESRSGADPEVKAWAAKTLPTLEEHLKMARDLNSSVATVSDAKR